MLKYVCREGIPRIPSLGPRLDPKFSQFLSCILKLRSIHLLAGLRVSRTFLLCQAGGKDAQTQQKHEIRKTLRADWLDSVYTGINNIAIHLVPLASTILALD